MPMNSAPTAVAYLSSGVRSSQRMLPSLVLRPITGPLTRCPLAVVVAVSKRMRGARSACDSGTVVRGPRCSVQAISISKNSSTAEKSSLRTCAAPALITDSMGMTLTSHMESLRFTFM